MPERPETFHDYLATRRLTGTQAGALTQELGSDPGLAGIETWPQLRALIYRRAARPGLAQGRRAGVEGIPRARFETPPSRRLNMSGQQRTTLLTITDQGEIELMTDDTAVMHKVRQAHTSKAVTSFVYSAGAAEEIINGRVTWLNEEPRFRFAVLAEEAGEGP